MPKLAFDPHPSSRVQATSPIRPPAANQGGDAFASLMEDVGATARPKQDRNDHGRVNDRRTERDEPRRADNRNAPVKAERKADPADDEPKADDAAEAKPEESAVATADAAADEAKSEEKDAADAAMIDAALLASVAPAEQATPVMVAAAIEAPKSNEAAPEVVVASAVEAIAVIGPAQTEAATADAPSPTAVAAKDAAPVNTTGLMSGAVTSQGEGMLAAPALAEAEAEAAAPAAAPEQSAAATKADPAFDALLAADPGAQQSAPSLPITQPTPRVADVQPVAASAQAAPAAPPAPAITIAALPVEIAARAQNGDSRFEIRLDPAELGRIDVRLDIDKSGQVTSRLVVERADTLELLRRDAHQLERALQDAGLRTSDSGLQFSLRDQGFAGRDEQRQQAGPASFFVERDALPADLTPYRQSARLGALDIRI